MTHQIAFGLDLIIPDDFGFWLAGFVDGEGCFFALVRDNRVARRHFLNFDIKLRADDTDILRFIHSTLKVGTISHREYKPPDKPQTLYRVNRIRDLQLVIVPFFEQYPLRSKKARDFEIWKQAVGIAGLSTRGKPIPDHLWHQYYELCQQLRQIRKFPT